MLVARLSRPASATAVPPATFVAAGLFSPTSGAGNFTFPGSGNCGTTPATSACAGDIMVVTSLNSVSNSMSMTTNAGAGTFTRAGGGGASANCPTWWTFIDYRVLSAGDVTTGNLVATGNGNDPIYIAIYRGPTVVTSKQLNGAAAGTTTTLINSFTPSGSTKGVAYALMNGGSAGSLTTTNTSGTWTKRTGTGLVATPGNAYFSGGFSDFLTSPSGAADTVGGLSAAGPVCAFVWEFT